MTFVEVAGGFCGLVGIVTGIQTAVELTIGRTRSRISKPGARIMAWSNIWMSLGIAWLGLLLLIDPRPMWALPVFACLGLSALFRIKASRAAAKARLTDSQS